MTIQQPISPAADPAGLGPDPDRAEEAVHRMAGDEAAMREFEQRQLDEMAVIAVDALRVLKIEILDPDNSPTDIPGLWVCAQDPTLAYVRLTRAARLTLSARARMAADAAEQGIVEAPEAAANRRWREEQIVLLMSSIGMDLLRVVQQEILAPWKAPTQGQGLRVHAGDPARSIELLTRAIRMNHAIRAKITDGTLGQRRRAKAAAPSRPARQQNAAAAAGTAATQDRNRTEPDESAAEAAEAVETDRTESESEDFWSEMDEDLDREFNELAVLDNFSSDALVDLARRVYQRHVAIYTRRHQPATQDDPVEPDPPDPDEDRDLPDSPVAEFAASVQAVLHAMSAPNGPEDALRRLAETLAATSRTLRPPGHDPP